MKFDPKKPFNELKPLPPSLDLETPLVLKACIEAHRELAQLKVAEQLIPNQTVLINSIPLLESQASSAIENIVTTTDELFESSQLPLSSISYAAKETLQYRQALHQGYKAVQERPLTLSLLCKICSTIRQVETNIRKLSGTALMNDLTSHVIYTPPDDEKKIRDLLTNWQNYIHAKSDKVDPLIKLAVQHYQLEAIHPFPDGNGRTGRVVNLLYLIQQDLLDKPILYLSGYIIKNKTEYYKKLGKVTTHGDWIDWILFFLKAIKNSALWTRTKIFAIQELMQETTNIISSKCPSVYSRELIELLFIHPYVRINNLVDALNIGRDTASKHLKALIDIGLLEEMKKGRDKLFINHRFLNLLRKA